MQKFPAATFFAIGKYLAYAKSQMSKLERSTKINPDSAAKETDPGKVLVAILGNCKAIGLSVSARCVDSALESVAAGTTVGNYVDLISQLENTILWEMEDRLFMFVPPDRAPFYNNGDLFGAAVNTKFPDIQFDVTEAGNTYASGRSTACVFHLMRVMERATQDFGTALDVTLTDQKNWQNILDEINKEIRKLPAKDVRTMALAEAATNLYNVKVAWRNPTMHPKQTYTLEEAENIFMAVKSFMQNLAEVL